MPQREQLKNIYFTRDSISSFADEIKSHYPAFDKKRFTNLLFDSSFEQKELKERMRHTTLCLHKTLPESYSVAIEILKKAAPNIKGFEAMSLPDYVELYGPDNWDLSMKALAHFTKFSSSEFAIRPFLDKNPEKGMEYMLKLTDNKDHKVRRFASEGCRPRLPWTMALPKFKKNPALIIPVLQKLKNDESAFVRRSVANNLNDISKDNPDIVLDICEKWYGKTQNTDAIVKHACRTMLKAGNKRALLIFGFGNPEFLNVKNLALEKDKVSIGEKVGYSFDLEVNEKDKTKIRIEYGVFYMKANGKLAKKVFQIGEKVYTPGTHTISRKHSFEEKTTRKHYEGEHQISIIVNGEEKAKVSLQLKKK